MVKPLVAFGDSNTVGHGLPGYVTNVPPAGAYIVMLASALGVSRDVRAKSGNMAADQSWSELYGTTPSASNHYTALLGTNDSQHYGSSSPKRAAAMDFYRNILIWNLCPDKILARQPGMTYIGSWSDTPANSVGKTTSALDAEAQATVAGTSIYVSYILQNASAAEATFDIFVDGVLEKTVALNGTAIGDSLLGQSYAGACVEVSGLDAGNHAVRVVNRVAGKSLFLEYIAGSHQSQRPHFFVGEIPYRTLAGYGASSNSDANVDAYNQAIAGMLSALAGSGHNVHQVSFDAFSPSMHYQADGVHFNAAGHEVLYSAFLQAVSEVDSALQFAAGGTVGALRTNSFVGNPVTSVTYY